MGFAALRFELWFCALDSLFGCVLFVDLMLGILVMLLAWFDCLRFYAGWFGWFGVFGFGVVCVVCSWIGVLVLVMRLLGVVGNRGLVVKS